MSTIKKKLERFYTKLWRKANMIYEFSVYQTKTNDHVFWVAESKALKGCVGQGENFIDAIKELEENEQE